MAFCVHPNAMLNTTIEVLKELQKTVSRTIFEENRQLYKSLVHYQNQAQLVKGLTLSNVGLFFSKKGYIDSSARVANKMIEVLNNAQAGTTSKLSDAQSLAEYKMYRNIEINRSLRLIFKKLTELQPAVEVVSDTQAAGGILSNVVNGIIIIVIGIIFSVVLGPPALAYVVYDKVTNSTKRFLLPYATQSNLNAVGAFAIYVVLTGINAKSNSNAVRGLIPHGVDSKTYEHIIKRINIPKDATYLMNVKLTLAMVLLYTLAYATDGQDGSKLKKEAGDFMLSQFGTKAISQVQRIAVMFSAKNTLERIANKKCLTGQAPSLDAIRMDKVYTSILNDFASYESQGFVRIDDPSYVFIKNTIKTSHEAFKAGPNTQNVQSVFTPPVLKQFKPLNAVPMVMVNTNSSTQNSKNSKIRNDLMVVPTSTVSRYPLSDNDIKKISIAFYPEVKIAKDAKDQMKQFGARFVEKIQTVSDLADINAVATSLKSDRTPNLNIEIDNLVKMPPAKTELILSPLNVEKFISGSLKKKTSKSVINLITACLRDLLSVLIGPITEELKTQRKVTIQIQHIKTAVSKNPELQALFT